MRGEAVHLGGAVLRNGLISAIKTKKVRTFQKATEPFRRVFGQFTTSIAADLDEKGGEKHNKPTKVNPSVIYEQSFLVLGGGVVKLPSGRVAVDGADLASGRLQRKYATICSKWKSEKGEGGPYGVALLKLYRRGNVASWGTQVRGEAQDDGFQLYYSGAGERRNSRDSETRQISALRGRGEVSKRLWVGGTRKKKEVVNSPPDDEKIRAIPKFPKSTEAMKGGEPKNQNHECPDDRRSWPGDTGRWTPQKVLCAQVKIGRPFSWTPVR